MRLLDFIAQTGLAVLTVVTLIAGIFYGHLLDLFFIGQFVLCTWQIASCIIHLVTDVRGNQARRKHLLLWIVYTIAILVLGLTPQVIAAFLYTIPAWSLAVYYYVITCKTTFPKTGRGKFLPHLSF